MARKKSPETMEELNTARGFVGRKKRKSRGCLLRLLAGIILLLLALYGFILARQWLLDLDAEAYARAVQTATARAGESTPQMLTAETQVAPHLQQVTLDSLDAARTATIAVQLTSVAEFQKTLTPEP